MASLILLVDQFNKRPLHNPPVGDVRVRVEEFIAEVQAGGADLGRWTEDEWIRALRKLGLNDEQIADELENVASWGVVDNRTWEDPPRP